MKKVAVILAVVGLVVAAGSPAQASLGYVKWYQPPDMGETGMDFYSEMPWIMASDWLCEDGLPVTDFHWWGSWKDNTKPSGLAGEFDAYLMVFKNDPGPPSHPVYGDPAWEHHLSIYDPNPGFHEEFYGTDAASNDVYSYQVDLPKAAWFHQEIGETYWFALSIGSECAPYWGWHNTADHEKFDSVYLDSNYAWQYLTYPAGHEWVGQSADLAFGVSTIPEPATVLVWGLLGLVAAGYGVWRRRRAG